MLIIIFGIDFVAYAHDYNTTIPDCKRKGKIDFTTLEYYSTKIFLEAFLKLLKSYLLSYLRTGTDTDFKAVSHQHLNFEIQILLERG